MAENPNQPPSFQELEREMQKLHPLVREVCLNLTAEGGVSADGVAKLKAGLDALKGQPSFFQTVDELLRCCYYWDNVVADSGKIEFKPAAAAVLGVLNQPDMIQAYHDAGGQVAHEHAEAHAERGKDFAQFADKEGGKAPQVGEKAPAGAVKLDKFNYPRKL
jgi:hypothetical protein